MKTINEHGVLLNEMKCNAPLETTCQLSQYWAILAKWCGCLRTVEIEVVADVCIFASVQKIDDDAALSVWFQSLKSPLADVVAHTNESLHSLINGTTSTSSSSTSGEDSSLSQMLSNSKRMSFTYVFMNEWTMPVCRYFIRFAIL